MLNFVIDALATYRLTKLVIDDEITKDLRKKWFEKFPPQSTKLGFMATCPWCAGFWVATGVVAARTVAPAAWEKAGAAFAFSAVAGMLEENL
jgi:hypothetical protein